MEKIKASKVLAMLKGLSGMYFTIDSDGSRRMHIGSKPIRMDSSFSSQFSIFLVKSKIPPSIDWKESLREIDFSEDFTEERLKLIDHITSYLAKELSLRDYNRIKGFFEEIGKSDYVKGFTESSIIGVNDFSNKSNTTPQETPIFKDFDGKFRPMGDLGQIVISSTKEPSTIFKIDDTVHVLSYSNIGEFGKSTDGVVKAIYKDGTILVKVEEGVEEVHKEDNVSFTPFSIKEAGFSQIRPVKEPMAGDWGFFYNQKPAKSFCYHKLYSMGNLKKVTIGVDYPFTTDGGSFYKYFSIEPPQLAEGIPNPFTKC